MLRARLAHRVGAFALEVAFEAPSPGITALYGPSGAGKSTLLQLLAGLAEPQSGHVSLGGRALYDSQAGASLPPEQRAAALVFQDLRLFPHLDVAGNLAFGERRAPGRQPLIERARVLELLGLGPLLARRVQGLSGGERQRVALGRALLARPSLLLLDEPLAALDAARRAELLPCLERLRAERALPILMVTHQYDDVLRLADHLLLMDGGRIVAAGSPLELATRPELRVRLPEGAVGALLEGRVAAVDGARGLAEVRIGRAGTLRVPAGGLAIDQPVRLQLLAHELVIATQEPRGLSVRNRLQARLLAIESLAGGQCLLELDADGTRLLARITRDACDELALAPGVPVWVLVKALSLAGHVY